MRSQDRSVDPKKKIREEFEWVFHFLDSLNAKYTGAFFRLGSCAKTAKTAKSGSQAARFFAAKSRDQKSGSLAACFFALNCVFNGLRAGLSWPLAGSTSTHLDFGPIWAPTCHTYDTPTRGPDAFTAF